MADARTKEIAELLGCSQRTVQRLIDAERLKAHRVAGGRTWAAAWKDVAAFCRRAGLGDAARRAASKTNRKE